MILFVFTHPREVGMICLFFPRVWYKWQTCKVWRRWELCILRSGLGKGERLTRSGKTLKLRLVMQEGGLGVKDKNYYPTAGKEGNPVDRNRIWSEFLLMVLLFVNQNASVLESSESRDYKKHSCRYVGHSCKQLLEHVLFASLLQQETALHSVRETRSVRQSSANQSDTTLLGKGECTTCSFFSGLEGKRSRVSGRGEKLAGDVRRWVCST